MDDLGHVTDIFSQLIYNRSNLAVNPKSICHTIYTHLISPLFIRLAVIMRKPKKYQELSYYICYIEFLSESITQDPQS